MRIRAIFGLGLATGYVLGARAGRERYESLIRTFRAVKERPAVQGRGRNRRRTGGHARHPSPRGHQ